MATLKVGDQKADVSDGGAIREAAESLGIPFSCKEGVCGSCISNVLSGAENLSSLSEAEKEYGLEEGGNQRLCCQAKITSGEVAIESAA